MDSLAVALREWLHRLWGTLRGHRMDRDLEEELRVHLELAAAEAQRHGGSPADARRVVRMRAGSVPQAMEALRDQRGLPWIEDLARDLRHGLRLLHRNPVFACAAVVSLALGIGANTAIFSLLDAVMLRALPVRTPERLVQLVRQRPPYGRTTLSYPLYERFRDDVPSLDGVLAQAWFGRREITVNGETETVNLELVSDNYYAVLGVDAVLGRTFSPAGDADDRPAVISYRFWRRRFGADPAAVGRSVQVNGTTVTIVGVTRPEFSGTSVGREADVTLPLAMDGVVRGTPTWRANPHFAWLGVMGRLREGRSLAQAQAEAGTVLTRANEAEAVRSEREAERKEILGQTVTLQPAGNGFDDLRQRFSLPLKVLMGLVALVLLMACANLANLLLARAATRQLEMTLRRALGAGRGRVIRQMLAEGVLLAGLGGALGVALAYWFANGLVTMMSNGGPRMALDIGPDSSVLGFAFVVSGASCLLFSLAPALQSAGSSGQTLADARTSRRWRFGPSLVAAQVAVAVLLLIGAGLFGRTLIHLYTLDAGFARNGILLFSVNTSKSGYTGERLRAVQARIVEEVGTVPGIASASLALMPPVSGGGWDGDLYVEGHASDPREDARAHLNAVGPRYFATLGTAVLAGREFTDRDGPADPRVAVVNETFARYYFGQRSPIGRWLSLDGPGRNRIEIVGMVKDMKYQSLRQTVPRTVFFALHQSKPAQNASAYVARTDTGTREAAAAIAAALRRVDPALTATQVGTLADHVARSILQDRLLAMLTACFGLLSLALVSVGVYGVVAFQAARRTKEMGIRMALGARPRQVIALVLRDTSLPVVAGLMLGLLAALPLTRLAESMLFGVTRTDPATFVGACGTLMALALFAGWLPGRRAANLNPARALRDD